FPFVMVFAPVRYPKVPRPARREAVLQLLLSGVQPPGGGLRSRRWLGEGAPRARSGASRGQVRAQAGRADGRGALAHQLREGGAAAARRVVDRGPTANGPPG